MCLLTKVLFFGFKGKLDKKAAFHSLTEVFLLIPSPPKCLRIPPWGQQKGQAQGRGGAGLPYTPLPS